MNNLDLRNYLLEEDEYVIIKRNDIFPAYGVPSDLDIICKKMKPLADKIKARHALNPFREYVTDDNHHQLDYHADGKLDFKFDLIADISIFNDEQISDKFIDEMLASRERIDINNHIWWVPSLEYEVVIRLIEFKMYPHKIKHKNFVDKHIDAIGVKELLEQYNLEI